MKFLLGLGFLQAMVATSGSLYYSEVLNLPPCELCWYQRILMFPLVLIYGVALLTHDIRVWRYTLPFALPGWLLSFYHTLLYENIIPNADISCGSGISCTTESVRVIGAVSLPSLSFAAFSILLAVSLLLMFQYRKMNKLP